MESPGHVAARPDTGGRCQRIRQQAPTPRTPNSASNNKEGNARGLPFRASDAGWVL
jgi:hypothetical protein